MKNNYIHDNFIQPDSKSVPVRFAFSDPAATTVCVAGTFNHWKATVQPMHPLGNGHWLKDTTLPPGIYEYRLIVDGRWIADPLAMDDVPNPFGGTNSILKVASSEDSTFLEEIENLHREIRAIRRDMHQQAEETRALMALTAYVAGGLDENQENELGPRCPAIRYQNFDVDQPMRDIWQQTLPGTRGAFHNSASLDYIRKDWAKSSHEPNRIASKDEKMTASENKKSTSGFLLPHS